MQTAEFLRNLATPKNTGPEAIENLPKIAIDALPQIVWTAKPNGRFTCFNQQLVNYTGLCSQEACNGAWPRPVHPEDLSLCISKWRKAARSGRPFEIEIRIRRASDQTFRWHLVRATPQHDADGKIIQWVGACTDIDDQSKSNRALEMEVAERQMVQESLKEMADTLEQRVADRSAIAEARARQLVEAESRFRQLAERIDDVFWVYELESNKISYVNPAYEKIAGLSVQSRLDDPDSYLSLVHVEDRGRAASAVERWGRGENTAEEYRIVRPDGAVRWIWERGFPIARQTGGICRVVGLSEDITERKQAAADLTSAKEAAEQASRTKSEFLANMSHEIRTPMTAILGYAELMRHNAPGGPDQGECVRVVQRNAKHLLDLINDILDLSKIEAGKMKVSPQVCDLEPLLAEVVSLMRARAEEKSLKFRFCVDGRPPRYACTDLLRLRQILMNLLGNAIKFTASGWVEMKLGCRRVEQKNQLQIDVSDSGIGMSGEQIQRLFMPFSQGEESTTRRFGGTGLGLSISRRLARLLGGDINVKSQPGAGAMFSLTIDAGTVDDPQTITELHESIASTQTAEDSSEPCSLRGRILLAEDGKDNQRLISTQLKMAGAEVVIAENGKAALDLAEAGGFDAILMDMQMPVMDGYSAAAELRRRGSEIPIIALTAHAMAEDRARCVNSGCSDYLTKPVQRGLLLQTLERYLGKAGNSTVIRSTLLNEPGMKPIIREFVDDLPVQVAQMQEMLRHGDLPSLRRAVHQLRGACGGYGFDAGTQCAAEAEEALKASDDLVSAAGKISSLIELIRSFEGFDEGKLAA